LFKFTAEKQLISVKQFIIIFIEHKHHSLMIAFCHFLNVKDYCNNLHNNSIKKNQHSKQPNVRERRKGLETNGALDIF